MVNHPRRSTLERLRSDSRVEHVSDERDSGNGVIVSLAAGFAIDPMVACHTFGEDTPSAALRTLRTVKECKCGECRPSVASILRAAGFKSVSDA